LGGIGSAQALSALGGQFSILSIPQMSLTMRLLNEDADAEFLANPRVVTADNQKATIKITRSQPVPQLNFNEQTAQAVFSGFQDKEFGNTLEVTPSINKDDFVSMLVQPEISNKVADATFTFSGSTVTSPVIDKRTLNSNVVIKSGDTLAIGGLLQDEQTKGRTKVPFMGDIPILGYLFQEKIAARTKRNLLVFVTPTIIQPGYGTGLEDQVSGLTHTGEEYADPNGWRNNAKGAKRIVPTSNRSIAADYAKPGVPPAPRKVSTVRVSSRSK
jgi:general secretion pathway protein D